TETYIATRHGKPMTKESIGNLFKEKCIAAGLTNRSAHGLRKAAATVAAENGATEAELDAIFGWTDRRMASHYTKKANRKKLAYGGVAKLERMTGSMDHRANVYSLTEKLGAGNRVKSSIESDGGLKAGGHDRDRTRDPLLNGCQMPRLSDLANGLIHKRSLLKDSILSGPPVTTDWHFPHPTKSTTNSRPLLHSVSSSRHNGF